MKLHLKVWRQAGPDAPGAFSEYDVDDAYEAMTLLELLDRLNDRLIEAGEEPIAFESDCREGICGCCGMNVNGRPHGPKKNTPSCHQHLSSFKDGDTITLEPMRSAVYPVVKDLIIDRGKLARVLEAGGWVRLPMLTPSTALTSRPSVPLTTQPASAVVPASRPAPTVLPTCSPAPSSCTWDSSPWLPWSAAAAPRTWWTSSNRTSVPVPTTANALRCARLTSRSPR